MRSNVNLFLLSPDQNVTLHVLVILHIKALWRIRDNATVNRNARHDFDNHLRLLPLPNELDRRLLPALPKLLASKDEHTLKLISPPFGFFRDAVINLVFLVT